MALRLISWITSNICCFATKQYKYRVGQLFPVWLTSNATGSIYTSFLRFTALWWREKEQYLPNLGQTTSHKERKFQLINWHTKLMSFKFDSLCYLSFSFHVPNLPNKQPLTLITKMACHPQIPCNTKNKIKTLSKKNSSL